MNAIQSSVKQLSGEDPLEEAFRLCRPGGLVALVLLAVFLLTAPAAHAQAPGYTQVSPGYTNTCALKTDGSIDCWGTNLWGQSKDQAGSFLQVTTGSDHSCAIMNTGQVDRGPVTCWGSNQEAQLQKPSGDFREISAGYMYTCGLTDGYDVNCWWYNYDGQANDQTGPYKHVFASIYHTCGLKLDGSVNCWGASSYGEAGDRTGPYTQIAVGGFHNCAIRSSDSQLECWGAGTKDTNLYPDYGQAMPPAGKFVDVAAGGLFTCGVREDHTLACWGYNFYGQVKRAPAGKFKQVNAGMGGHACAMSDSNELYCWGRNDFGQTHIPNLGGPTDAPVYNFQGFFAPVQADPLLNAVNAGSSVPLKFSLGGDQGLKVIEQGYPASGPLDCKAMDPSDDLTPTAPAGKTRLSYDPASDTYTYVWKTEKAWARTCRYLSLQLIDGTEHRVAFQFK